MKNTLCLLFVLLQILLLSGCDMIEYHPYDVDIDGETNLTAKNVSLIEKQCAGKDTIRFVHISDTQRQYDDTQDIVNHVNTLPNIDFVVHTGDLTDFGLAREYEWMRSVLSGLKVPYVTAVGNHDCLGTGESSYDTMYGPDNFSLNASFLHLVSINTNAYEYDYSTAIPDFDFMKKDIAQVPDSVTNTIVAMHIAPYMTLFNDNVAEYFNQVTKQYPHLMFCICGHDHEFEVFYPFGKDEPTYIQCDAAKSRTYVIYTVTRESFSYELVKL